MQGPRQAFPKGLSSEKSYAAGLWTEAENEAGDRKENRGLGTSPQLTAKWGLSCLSLDHAGYLPSWWHLPWYSWGCRCSLEDVFLVQRWRYRGMNVLYIQVPLHPSVFSP